MAKLAQKQRKSDPLLNSVMFSDLILELVSKWFGWYFCIEQFPNFMRYFVYATLFNCFILYFY